MKKKNGFTLVELLAILIILGIIAVITVPIISKILKDARINTLIDSSYGYVRAVDKLYYSKSLNDEDIVEDGIYTVSELKALGVSVDGREPSEGWVELEESEVVAFSIKIGDYVITKYRNEGIIVEKSDTVALTENEKMIVSLIGITNQTDGARYLTGLKTIYYNPETANVCTEMDYDNNNDKLGLTGCLEWFLYSAKGEYANMILDHHINAGCTIAACKWADSNNSSGPVIALSNLDLLTSSWATRTPKVPNMYGSNGEEITPQIVPLSANDNKYSIDYTGYKARLITKEEVERIAVANNNNTPSKLYSNFPYYQNGYNGYWTSSSYSNAEAWYVRGGDGRLNTQWVKPDAVQITVGLRPVITVPVGDVLE